MPDFLVWMIIIFFIGILFGYKYHEHSSEEMQEYKEIKKKVGDLCYYIISKAGDYRIIGSPVETDVEKLDRTIEITKKYYDATLVVNNNWFRDSNGIISGYETFIRLCYKILILDKNLCYGRSNNIENQVKQLTDFLEKDTKNFSTIHSSCTCDKSLIDIKLEEIKESRKQLNENNLNVEYLKFLEESEEILIQKKFELEYSKGKSKKLKEFMSDMLKKGMTKKDIEEEYKKALKEVE